MQRFYESVLEPIFKLENIKTIVEIGAERGISTSKLIKYAQKNGGKIYTIDPAPLFDADLFEKENPNTFVMVKDLSLNAVMNIKDADCFLIDGDHNWYTVYHELKMIYDTYGEDNFPLIFFHDILWPYDRRDLYYSPENIPAVYINEYEKKAINPDSDMLCSVGLNERHYNAKKYGGKQNGVLTAVEDFITDYPSLELKFMSHNVLFGLGMIASVKKYPHALDYFCSTNALSGMMKVCERERIDKMIEIRSLLKRLEGYTSREKQNKIAKVYPNFGEGFSEATAILIGEYDSDTGYYYAKAEFEQTPTELRFDPVNDSFCIVDDITVTGDKGKAEIIRSNGTKIGKSYIFTNNDPQIIYNCAGSKKFVIRAEIIPFKSTVTVDLLTELLNTNLSLSTDNSALMNTNRMLSEETRVLSEETRVLSESNKTLSEENSVLSESNKTLSEENRAFSESNKTILKENASLLKYKKELSFKVVSSNKEVIVNKNNAVKSEAALKSKYEQQLSEFKKSKDILNSEIIKTKSALDAEKRKTEKLSAEQNKLSVSVATEHRLAEKLICAEGGVGWKYALRCALRNGIFAAKTNIKAIKKIRKDGGFDVLLYCSKYNDVISEEIDPLIHFMWFGGYEGRNPSSDFDVKQYAQNYADIKKSGVNPYAHYLIYGKDEGRSCVPKKIEKKETIIVNSDISEKEITTNQLSNTDFVNKSNPTTCGNSKKETAHNTVPTKILNQKESSVEIIKRSEEAPLRSYNFSQMEARFRAVMKNKVDVIMPIYNAYEETSECIESFIQNTDFPYHLMLINDCSTDPRIQQLLKNYENNEDITVYNNEKNLGFVGTMNFGITHTENDVVFLNSDTKLTKGWLRKLAIAACSQENIATVTPFSNAAGAFSVPEYGVNDNIPQGFTLEQMALIVEKNSDNDYVNVPTGNGFCMYVTRKALNIVGLLDQETFSRGYGEENDFCMRAKANGLINIICDNTYIYHKRSASFGAEKAELIQKNSQILRERYPTYKQEISVFSNDPALNKVRSRIKNAIDSYKPAKKRILYVIHYAGGGTVKTNEDLMMYISSNNYEVFMLCCDFNDFYLYEVNNGRLELIKTMKNASKWHVSNILNTEYRNLYFDVINGLHIDLVHVRHIVKNSFDVFDVCDILNVPVVMSFHDFFFICPTINLINSDGVYCEGICRDCDRSCMFSSKHISIGGENTNKWVKNVWQPAVRKYMSNVKRFITTAEYAKNLYTDIYPEFESRFAVIEHGRDFAYKREYCGSYCRNGKIRILLPGNIGFHKGEKYIEQLLALDKQDLLEIHIMGNTTANLISKVVYHGTYKREEFKDRLMEIKPDYIGILSIWPETYCHVLTEAWSCGMPCIVSDIGVLKERGTGHGCILANLDNPSETYDKIIMTTANKNEYEQLCKEALSAVYRSVNEMGRDYKKIYDDILSAD